MSHLLVGTTIVNGIEERFLFVVEFGKQIGIAVNECLDFLRKQKNSSMIHTDDVESGVANMLVADNYFDGDETEAMLQEAISQLPDVQRTVFTLRYYDDMKYSEMSRILKTSEGSLKASYHIAVKKISEFFKHRD